MKNDTTNECKLEHYNKFNSNKSESKPLIIVHVDLDDLLALTLKFRLNFFNKFFSHQNTRHSLCYCQLLGQSMLTPQKFKVDPSETNFDSFHQEVNIL